MLKGKKVNLRPIEERDLELIVRWRNDAQNRRFFLSPFLINPGGQKNWYQNLLADRDRMVFMIDNLEGKTVGMIGASRFDWRNQVCEGGQFLVDPDERSHGYAEEAVTLFVNYVFEELNINRMNGFAFSWSPAIKLYKMLGFQVEGVMRQAVFRGGKFHDVAVLGLLREDWQKGLMSD